MSETPSWKQHLQVGQQLATKAQRCKPPPTRDKARAKEGQPRWRILPKTLTKMSHGRESGIKSVWSTFVHFFHEHKRWSWGACKGQIPTTSYQTNYTILNRICSFPPHLGTGSKQRSYLGV